MNEHDANDHPRPGLAGSFPATMGDLHAGSLGRAKADLDAVKLTRPLDRASLISALHATVELLDRSFSDQNSASNIVIVHPVRSVLNLLATMLKDLDRGITDELLRPVCVKGRAEGARVREAAAIAAVAYRALRARGTAPDQAFFRIARDLTSLGYRGRGDRQLTAKNVKSWVRGGLPGAR